MTTTNNATIPASVKDVLRRSHSIANILPMMSGEEFLGLKSDIERNGVLDPVWYYQGKILDGRNRERAVTELNTEGKKLSRTLVVDGVETVSEESYSCPTAEFIGTDLQALEFVRSKGVNRRQLTSGQKAVVAVRHMLLCKRFTKAARRNQEALTGEAAALEALPADGDIAAWIAARAGTNRTYIFRALKLAEARGGNALLDQIMEGNTTINAALQSLAEATAEEEGGAEETIPVVLDGRRNAVPDELHDIFLTRDSFKEIDQTLRGLITAVEQIADGPGGKYLHETELKGFVDNLRSSLKKNAPYAVCPKCSGDGREPSNRRQNCGLCKKNKYVSKLIFDAWNAQQGAPVVNEESEEAADEVAEAVQAVESAESAEMANTEE